MGVTVTRRGLGKRLARLGLAGLVVLSLGFVPGAPGGPVVASAGQITTTAPVPGEIVVQPRSGKSIADITARNNLKTLFQFTDSPAALVSTPDLSGALARLAKDSSVEWFEANNTARQPAAKDDSGADPYCGTTTTTTTSPSTTDDSGADPFCTRVITNGATAYASQWLDTKIGLADAQKRGQGKGVSIAVLDTAIETGHPALAGKLLPGMDLLPLDPQSNVATTGIKRGHGTFVAGVALHVAPAARVLPVRVLNEDGHGSTSLVAEGIRRAAKAGAQVINLSLSTPTPSRAMQEAVTYAQGRGALLVAAYGNEGLVLPPVYPAGFTGVLSVVATGTADVLAPFTNYGYKADIAAPGVNIVGPWRDGQYGIGSGTSYAAPLVSGEAAILLSAGVAKNAGDAQARIVVGGININKVNNQILGFLRVDVPAALAFSGSTQLVLDLQNAVK